MESETRKQVVELIRDKLKRLAIRESGLSDSFDLVKSGLLNSLEFVDLVASIEKTNDHEIDFEKELDSGDFTTLGGLIRAFENNEMMGKITCIKLEKPDDPEWDAVERPLYRDVRPDG